ncbi:MAG UNVERIFIED_CONTAM: hypothetical protein LVR18_50590 [Planctomycetaceae bacterium]
MSECVVLHSTPAWGGQHAELDAEATGKAMLQEFGRLAGIELPEPDVVNVHRWRYAEPQGYLPAAESLPRSCTELLWASVVTG